MLREGQMLFTYLHLAPDHAQCRDLIHSGAVCIAYETVTGPVGDLPLLATRPFVLALADKGWQRACAEDPHLRAGLNVVHGRVVHPAVAAALDLPLEAAVVQFT